MTTPADKTTPADGAIPPQDGAIPPTDGAIPPKDGAIPPADKKTSDGAGDEKPGDSTLLGADRESDDTGPADEKSKVPDSYAGVLRLPEGGPVMDAMLPELEAEAKVLGLTISQAERFVEARAASVQARKALFLEETKSKLGTNYDQTVDDARRFMRHLAPVGSDAEAALVEMFETSGYGNHHAVLEGFARLGRQLREDAPAGDKTKRRGASADPRDTLFPSTAEKS